MRRKRENEKKKRNEKARNELRGEVKVFIVGSKKDH